MFERARAVLRYNDTSRRLLLGFKYADRTEGAPAAACARALLRGGAAAVDVLVLARVVRADA